MKTHLLFALCAMLIAVAPAHTQTTQTEIQVDLLRLQIFVALQAENYAGAADLFDQYDALGVAMPPPLQLQRAMAYFHLKRYLDAENQLQAYLQRAERGSDGYNQALSMLAEVAPLVAAAKAEAARKAAAARERQRQKRLADAARTPECKGKGAGYKGSSLHEATEQNTCISAALLIEDGADVNAKNNYGNTPLHRAAVYNATETAALLIQHGANVNAKDSNGETPLHYAARNNATETAALLIQHGANVNAKNSNGEAPLHITSKAWQNATETAALLIQHGANMNAKNSNGETPLHYAARNNATETAALLIQHGANVNAKNSDGETPLHIAAVINSTEIAALLIQHGADVKAKNNEGKTPLKSMATNKNRDRNEVKAMKKLFREYGRK